VNHAIEQPLDIYFELPILFLILTQSLLTTLGSLLQAFDLFFSTCSAWERPWSWWIIVSSILSLMLPGELLYLGLNLLFFFFAI
jgi:hypothetical protein